MWGLELLVDWGGFLDSLTRLGVAVVLGGLLGVERQLHGRWAGSRTLMSVSMGAAVFVIIATQVAQGNPSEITRVVQGIAAGVGFLGAGAILKLSNQLEVKGLTTASAIWLAAAVGTASGLGMFGLAIAATLISLVVLALLRPLDKAYEHRGKGGDG